MADPAVKARLTEMDTLPMGGTAAAFGHFIASETRKWAEVVQAAKLKPE